MLHQQLEFMPPLNPQVLGTNSPKARPVYKWTFVIDIDIKPWKSDKHESLGLFGKLRVHKLRSNLNVLFSQTNV